ncbi:hypothetical protein Tco_0850207 [Tanacetum coccineum]
MSMITTSKSFMKSQASKSDSFGCWVKLQISPMSRSNIAGGKNRLTKACLIPSQVVITLGLNSVYQTLATLERDDVKSFSLMESTWLPYQNTTVNLMKFGVCAMLSARTRPSDLTVFEQSKELMSFHAEGCLQVQPGI